MWEDMGYTKKDGLDEADVVYKKWIARMRKQKRLDGIMIEDESGKPLASGCVFLYEVHPRPGRPGPYEPYILSMYTERKHRGRGLAKTIVDELLKWSVQRGYGAVFLHASDMGRSLYEKIGFVAGREMRWRAPQL